MLGVAFATGMLAGKRRPPKPRYTHGNVKAAPSSCPHRGRDGTGTAVPGQVPARAGKSPRRGCSSAAVGGADALGLPCGQGFILLSCGTKSTDVLRAQAAPCNPAIAAWGRAKVPEKARTRSPPGPGLRLFGQPGRAGRGSCAQHCLLVAVSLSLPGGSRRRNP